MKVVCRLRNFGSVCFIETETDTGVTGGISLRKRISNARKVKWQLLEQFMENAVYGIIPNGDSEYIVFDYDELTDTMVPEKVIALYKDVTLTVPVRLSVGDLKWELQDFPQENPNPNGKRT